MVVLGEAWGTQPWEDGVCVCPYPHALTRVPGGGRSSRSPALFTLYPKALIFSVAVSVCVSVRSSIYPFLPIE